MPILNRTPSFPLDLRQALGADGATEYQQLVRVIRVAQGSFFLFIVESDFPVELRNRLLKHLGEELAAEGLRLRHISLSHESWDPFDLLGRNDPVAANDVVVLDGIEETPDILQEPAQKASRAPLFALLNHLRETVGARIPVPLVVWCLPSIYTQFQREASNFFDRYCGLFQFRNATPGPPDIQASETSSVVSRYTATEAAASGAQRRIAFYERRLAELPESGRARTDAMLGLAKELLKAYGSNDAIEVERGLNLARGALRLLSPETHPYDWGWAQRTAGTAYLGLSRMNRRENVRQAIACFQAALQVFTEADFPREWAGTQNNLGLAYAALPGQDRAQSLTDAIACYQNAFRVYTETDFPRQWAGLHNNIGNAYANFFGDEWAQRLRQAIDCYQAALQVYTEADFPREWAGTQYNIGLTWYELSTGDHIENARQAVDYLLAALRVRTEQQFPRQWADTQHTLGNCYFKLREVDGSDSLSQAISCYQAALKVYTEAESPRQWAATQKDMGLALCYRMAWNDGVAAYRLAAWAYRQIGMDKEADRVEETAQTIEQQGALYEAHLRNIKETLAHITDRLSKER